MGWYDRYKKDGLTTSYLAEAAPTLNGTKIFSLDAKLETTPASEVKQEKSPEPEGEPAEATPEGIQEEEPAEPEDTTGGQEGEPTGEPETAPSHTLEEVQALSFTELKSIVQDNNLPLKGRGKDDYRAAVCAFYGLEE